MDLISFAPHSSVAIILLILTLVSSKPYNYTLEPTPSPTTLPETITNTTTSTTSSTTTSHSQNNTHYHYATDPSYNYNSVNETNLTEYNNTPSSTTPSHTTPSHTTPSHTTSHSQNNTHYHYITDPSYYYNSDQEIDSTEYQSPTTTSGTVEFEPSEQAVEEEDQQQGVCEGFGVESPACFLNETFLRGCCKKNQICCGNSVKSVCCRSHETCEYDRVKTVFYCDHKNWIPFTTLPVYWILAGISYFILSRKLKTLTESTVVANNAVQYTVTNPSFSPQS